MCVLIPYGDDPDMCAVPRMTDPPQPKRFPQGGTGVYSGDGCSHTQYPPHTYWLRNYMRNYAQLVAWQTTGVETATTSCVVSPVGDATTYATSAILVCQCWLKSLFLE